MDLLHVLKRSVDKAKDMRSPCDVDNRFLGSVSSSSFQNAWYIQTSLRDVQKTMFFPVGPASTLSKACLSLNQSQNYGRILRQNKSPTLNSRHSAKYRESQLLMVLQKRKKTTNLPHTIFSLPTPLSVVVRAEDVSCNVKGTRRKLGQPSIRLSRCCRISPRKMKQHRWICDHALWKGHLLQVREEIAL